MIQAAKTMGKKHIGSLIVVKYKTPVAIVTERDLLSKVLACNLDLEKTLVRAGHVVSAHQDMPALPDQGSGTNMINKKGRLAVFVLRKARRDYHRIRSDP